MNLCYHLAFPKRLLNLYIPIKFLKTQLTKLEVQRPNFSMIFRPDETKQTDNLRVFMTVTISQHGWRLFRFRNSFHKVSWIGFPSNFEFILFSNATLFCRSICYLLNKIPWDHSSATRWTLELLCLHNDNNSLGAREPCCRAVDKFSFEWCQ